MERRVNEKVLRHHQQVNSSCRSSEKHLRKSVGWSRCGWEKVGSRKTGIEWENAVTRKGSEITCSYPGPSRALLFGWGLSPSPLSFQFPWQTCRRPHSGCTTLAPVLVGRRVPATETSQYHYVDTGMGPECIIGNPLQVARSQTGGGEGVTWTHGRSFGVPFVGGNHPLTTLLTDISL